MKLINFFKVLFKFIKKVTISFYKKDLFGISGEIAFYTVFSLFPIIISLMAVLSLFSKNPDFYLDLTRFIYSSLPEEIASFLNYNLRSLSNSSLSSSALLFGIIITLWTSSNTIMAFIKGIDRAYDIKESRSYLSLRMLSLSLMFSIGFLLTFSFSMIVFGENFINWALNLNNKILPQDTILRLNIIRWSSVSIVLFLLSSLLYFKAPNIKHKYADIIPGAVFFSLAWSLATTLFGYYLNLFPTYNATYGALGTMIVLLLWFYISASIFLIGAQINASLNPEKIITLKKSIISYLKKSFIFVKDKILKKFKKLFEK